MEVTIADVGDSDPVQLIFPPENTTLQRRIYDHIGDRKESSVGITFSSRKVSRGELSQILPRYVAIVT